MLPLIVLFAPWFAAVGVAWVARARIESRLLGRAHPAPSPRSTVLAGLRRNAIVIVPLFVLIGLQEAVHVLGELGWEGARNAARWMQHLPLLQLGVYVALILLLAPLLPRIVSWLTKATPLPPGTLRARLEDAAEAMHLRYNELLVWNTQGRILNAMVVGFTGGSRRILFTDRLLGEMPADEVAAVFMHEAGHAKLKHLPLYLVLFLSFALLFHAAEPFLRELGIPPLVVLIGHLAIFWFVLLGTVSRRFEREADLYGVDRAQAHDPDAGLLPLDGRAEPVPAGAVHLIRAFRRLQRLTSGRMPTHRHGSLEERMRHVAAYATSPSVRAAERRRFRHVRLAIFALAAIAVGVTLPRPARGGGTRTRVDGRSRR